MKDFLSGEAHPAHLKLPKEWLILLPTHAQTRFWSMCLLFMCCLCVSLAFLDHVGPSLSISMWRFTSKSRSPLGFGRIRSTSIFLEEWKTLSSVLAPEALLATVFAHILHRSYRLDRAACFLPHSFEPTFSFTCLFSKIQFYVCQPGASDQQSEQILNLQFMASAGRVH